MNADQIISLLLIPCCRNNTAVANLSKHLIFCICTVLIQMMMFLWRVHAWNVEGVAADTSEDRCLMLHLAAGSCHTNYDIKRGACFKRWRSCWCYKTLVDFWHDLYSPKDPSKYWSDSTCKHWLKAISWFLSELSDTHFSKSGNHI